MNWYMDPWGWALENGGLVPILLALFVTGVALLVTATVFIWAVAALKWVGVSFREGYRRSG